MSGENWIEFAAESEAEFAIARPDDYESAAKAAQESSNRAIKTHWDTAHRNAYVAHEHARHIAEIKGMHKEVTHHSGMMTGHFQHEKTILGK